MTQLGEAIAVTTITDPDRPHWVQVEYKYANGRPVKGQFLATDSEGMTWAGTLNDQGQACLSGLPPGSVEFELVSEDTEEELKQMRASIKTVLDGIIADEKAEAAKHEKELAQQNALMQAGSHYWAYTKGFWNGAVGLVTFAKDVVVKTAEVAQYLNPLERVNNLLHAGYKSYQDGTLTSAEWKQNLAKNLQDEEIKDIARILGIDARHLSREGLQQLKELIAEAYEITAFIADDPESLDLLTQFGKDYAGAQSSIEWAEFAGGGVFEIVLAALLLMFTGGVGNVAQGVSKIRHANKLKSLGSIFRNLGKVLKRKKLRRKIRVNVDTKKPVQTELPKDRKPSVHPIKRMDEHKVPCFNPYDKKKYQSMTPSQQQDYLKEYAKQLQRQQDTINNMTTAEFKAARDAYKANGRNPLADAMQSDMRNRYERDIKRSIQESILKKNPNMPIKEARQLAGEKTKGVMDKLVALHEPDMVSGGYNQPDPKHLGRADANSAIGGSWNQKDRLSGMDRSVDKALSTGTGETKMNVKLEVCRG